MDLLIEKGGKRTYLSRYKVITTSFEESSPSVKRNNTQIQYRNGNVDFGGWNEAKTIDYVGYCRADDLDDEEYLRERIYALLSDPDGYYITQLKNDNDNSFERPGETSGDYFDKQVNRPSHKRFYVYASSLESELVGSYGGHVLYKISATFTTMKLPYGESVPRDLDVKQNVPYYGRNLWIRSKVNHGYVQGSNGLPTATGVGSADAVIFDPITITASAKSLVMTIYNPNKLVNTVNTSKPSFFNGSTYLGSQKFFKLTGDAVQTVKWDIPAGATKVYLGSLLGAANGAVDPSIHVKYEFDIATPWSPAPEDPEYKKWYLDTYYNTDNLVIPYAGTVPCNQLEQGFTVEFTAKEAGSNLKLSLNGIDFIAPGNVSSGDVFKLSGYEYLRNGISIVKATNKAWFKLLPGIANKVSSSIAGEIKILNFQNLYA